MKKVIFTYQGNTKHPFAVILEDESFKYNTLEETKEKARKHFSAKWNPKELSYEITGEK